MKVKMLVNIPGSDDGIVVQLYKRGEIYEVSDRLGKIFLKGEGDVIFAELATEKKMENPVVENKMIEPKVENKIEETGFADKIEEKVFGKKKRDK